MTGAIRAGAILTVDDVPSSRFAEKLAFLVDRDIPGVLFCWGEKIAGQEGLLIEALHRGYVLGNHSWTHPRFSQLSLSQARGEILETETALEGLHRRAGVPRAHRYFRFPYFDRGATPEQTEAFEALLVACGFEALHGPGTSWGCTFDQAEYRLSDTEALERITPGALGAGDVILIHDHETTHEVFFACVEAYRRLGLGFTLPCPAH